jgi:hypothetical protein
MRDLTVYRVCVASGRDVFEAVVEAPCKVAALMQATVDARRHTGLPALALGADVCPDYAHSEGTRIAAQALATAKVEAAE